MSLTTQKQVQAVAAAVVSGSIATENYPKLIVYYGWLAHPDARQHIPPQQFETVIEGVRIHLFRSVIEAFERRSKVQAWATLGFAVIAIVATLMPYFIAPSPNRPATNAPTAQAATTSKHPSPHKTKSPGTIPNETPTKD